MRRLIVNADDFGLTLGVNQAIVRAHRQGIVSSTSLMATGDAFSEAVALAKETPTLAIGCHVALVDGQPISEPSTVSSLLVKSGQQRPPFRFRETSTDLAKAQWMGRLQAQEVEREAIVQIRRLQSEGIEVTHVDTHQHVHMLPQIAASVLRGAKKCGVHAARNPFEPLQYFQPARLIRFPVLWSRYAKFTVLGRYSNQFRRLAASEGIGIPDGIFGVLVTGFLTEEIFGEIIKSLPEGTWEFICHPGYCDDDLQKQPTRLLNSRELELGILTSFARPVLERQGIELITYRDIARGQK